MVTRKGQTTIYNTLHRKLKLEQREPHLKPGVNSMCSGGMAVAAPRVAPVVLFLLQT